MGRDRLLITSTIPSTCAVGVEKNNTFFHQQLCVQIVNTEVP